MAANTLYPYNALQDASQFPSLLVASGTAGTSDTTGTAEPIRVGGNPATGAIYVQDLSGASGTTNVNVVGGSVTVTLGTVVGNIASGAADSGNPVKVGGVYNSTQPTVTTGQRVDEQSDERGNKKVYLATKLDSTNDSVAVGNGTLTLLSSIAAGTQNTLGTVGLLNAGTVSAVNTIVAGTQNTLGTIGVVNSGTLGAVTSVTNLVGGTVTAVNTIVAGTQNTLGTVGVLNAGSVVVTAGTIAAHAITNLAAGTVSAVNTIVAGTQNTLGTVGVLNAGTLGAVTSVTNLVGGTVTAVNTIVAGTLNTLGTVGVLNAGTITAVTSVTNLVGGTIRQQWQPVTDVLSFGTLGTAGGSFFGTISGASGAGTKHVVSNIDIVATSGTPTVMVLYGTALSGGSVLAQGAFVPSAGIAKSFNPVMASGTGSEITYHFVTAGTARITVNYWKSTL